jgi:SPP1 family predicted phage head-tail adaptor
MLFRDVLDLISVTTTEDELGGVSEIKTNRQVFANKKSIRQNEFYDAHKAGLNPRIMFEVRTAEYQGEKLLSFEGEEHNIIRTYDKNGEITELICSRG